MCIMLLKPVKVFSSQSNGKKWECQKLGDLVNEQAYEFGTM